MTTVYACLILIGIIAFAVVIAWADRDLRRHQDDDTIGGGR